MTARPAKKGKATRDPKKKSWPCWPQFGEEERKNVLAVLESGKWWYGEKVREFENKFASFQDARYGVSCTNGTAALEMALLSLGIGPGDEVIVPPYTFVATASAVLRVNALPVFADVELETVNLDPRDTESKISEKTKAIIPVHFAGLPADMDAFRELGRKYNLRIIEDACHSWGSKWKGKGTGALGDCGVFSFQMSKNLTSAEGGILLTNDKDLAARARSYSNAGRGEEKPWYEHYLLGSNLRMTEIQAALLLAQLARLEEQTRKREENGRFLDEKLRGLPGIKTLKRDPRVTRRSYHLYVFRFIEEEWGMKKEEFIAAAGEEGIPLRPGYPFPLYQNPLFQRKGEGPRYCPLSCPYYGKTIDYSSVFCPNGERICREAVWISHPLLLAEKEDMEDIARAVEKIWKKRKKK